MYWGTFNSFNIERGEPRGFIPANYHSYFLWVVKSEQLLWDVCEPIGGHAGNLHHGRIRDEDTSASLNFKRITASLNVVIYSAVFVLKLLKVNLT